MANEKGSAQTRAVKSVEVFLRKDGDVTKGASCCCAGVVSSYVHTWRCEVLCIGSSRILLESKAKEGDSPVYERVDICTIRCLEYGGTREILSESSGTIRKG